MAHTLDLMVLEAISKKLEPMNELDLSSTKLDRSLCMADPDPNAIPQVPVVWEPACSTVQTVFSYSTVCGD